MCQAGFGTTFSGTLGGPWEVWKSLHKITTSELDDLWKCEKHVVSSQCYVFKTKIANDEAVQKMDFEANVKEHLAAEDESLYDHIGDQGSPHWILNRHAQRETAFIFGSL